MTYFNMEFFISLKKQVIYFLDSHEGFTGKLRRTLLTVIKDSNRLLHLDYGSLRLVVTFASRLLTALIRKGSNTSKSSENDVMFADSDDSERPEFLKHLSSLRREAPVFLAMLNETRRQVRELRRPHRNDSTIQAYKYVVNFSSRDVYLLYFWEIFQQYLCQGQ